MLNEIRIGRLSEETLRELNKLSRPIECLGGPGEKVLVRLAQVFIEACRRDLYLLHKGRGCNAKQKKADSPTRQRHPIQVSRPECNESKWEKIPLKPGTPSECTEYSRSLTQIRVHR